MIDLSIELAGHRLRNPVMNASGPGGSGRELHRFFDLARLGAFVSPSILAEPRAGSDAPRAVETASGVLSAADLPGPGVTAFVEHDLPWLASVGAAVIPSISGTTSTEFAHVAAALRAANGFEVVLGVEVNLSLANEANRGVVFASDPLSAAKVVALVREQLPRAVAVLAKLSPDVTDLPAIAAACVKAGADGLVMINSVPGMAIDPDTLSPRLSVVTGGLTGPSIRPIAVRAIWQVRQAMFEGRIPTVPILGVGGIRAGRDALELVAAGASAVQVGTAIINDPSAPVRVLDELTQCLEALGCQTFTDVIAAAHER